MYTSVINNLYFLDLLSANYFTEKIIFCLDIQQKWRLSISTVHIFALLRVNRCFDLLILLDFVLINVRAQNNVFEFEADNQFSLRDLGV